MLQRTRADAVQAVRAKFFERFPNVDSLASATPAEVLRVLRPLGLYWRSRGLPRLARELEARFNGRIPVSEEKLLSLPGVGAYVASAFLVNAAGASRIAVDSNVGRVLSRLVDAMVPVDAARSPRLRELAASLVGGEESRVLNWAILDLAASICTRESPNCEVCPVAGGCMYARRRGRGQNDESRTRA